MSYFSVPANCCRFMVDACIFSIFGRFPSDAELLGFAS